jgi:hypothetical protein
VNATPIRTTLIGASTGVTGTHLALQGHWAPGLALIGAVLAWYWYQTTDRAVWAWAMRQDRKAQRRHDRGEGAA